MNKNIINGISVVIPTHGRYEYLKILFNSLIRAIQKTSKDVEVIIVDSTSDDNGAKIKDLCSKFGFSYLRGTRNVSTSRNIGIKNATKDVVLFVDSDCMVSEGIFEEHIRSYERTSDRVAGCLGVTEFTGEIGFGWRVMERASFGSSFSFSKHLKKADWGTCTNLSVRREVLEEIGGFDTEIPVRLGGEDVDLCWRIRKAGYEIICNPSALVYHHRETWNSMRSNVDRAFRWGRAEFYLQKKHPDKVGYDIPKYSTFFFIISFMFWGLVILNKLHPLALMLPLVLLFLPFSVGAIMTLKVFQKSIRLFPHQLFAEILFFIYDLGLIFQSIRAKSLQGFYKRVIVMHSKNGMTKWHKDVIRSWSICISILIVSMLVLFLI